MVIIFKLIDYIIFNSNNLIMIIFFFVVLGDNYDEDKYVFAKETFGRV